MPESDRERSYERVDEEYPVEGRRQNRPYERRRRVDKLTRSIQICGWIAWGFAILCALFWMTARPDQPNFFTRLMKINVIGGWNQFYLRLAFGLMVATLVICVFGLIVNMMRHKRKTDRFNKSIIILGIVSIVGMILMLILSPVPIF